MFRTDERKTESLIKVVLNENYKLFPPGFSEKLVELMRESLEISLKFYSQKIDNLNLDNMDFDSSISDHLKDIRESIIIYLIKKLRNEKDKEFIDRLRSIDLTRLTHYQDMSKVINDGSNITLPILGEISRDEKLYMILLNDMFIGISDSADFIYNISCIKFFLDERNITFNFETYLLKVGFNDLQKLVEVQGILYESPIILESFFSQELGSIDKKEGKKGCPFVIYSTDLVLKFVRIIYEFAQKIQNQIKNRHIRSNSGFGINFILRDDFEFDRYELLELPYFKQL